MAFRLPHVLWLAVALAACNRPPATNQAQTPAPPLTLPAAAPSATSPLAGTGDAHVNGYGALRFEMTADEVKKAWGGELNGNPGPGETCYYLTPKWARTPRDFGFMIESDKFVRYDVGNDKETAPGGGKRGMSAEQIRRLYAGRVNENPHKYVRGGSYLRIKTNDDSGGVLLFETGADGKVTAWHVGQVPQVDYVEGCS
jgi:hypothetical protein